MGRLTEFSCPKNKEYITILGGSPAGVAVFSQPVNHVIINAAPGSGWLAFDSTSTSKNGVYITDFRQFDVTTGSVSFYSGTAGSINVIGLF